MSAMVHFGCLDNLVFKSFMAFALLGAVLLKSSLVGAFCLTINSDGNWALTDNNNTDIVSMVAKNAFLNLIVTFLSSNYNFILFTSISVSYLYHPVSGLAFPTVRIW